MKKYVVFVMVFTLLLCAACQKQPETPESPETPEPPQQEQPVTPEVPETPEQPVAPETPEEPEVPETPVVPETPTVPETPETPEVPEAPEAPVVAEPEGFVSVAKLPGDVPGAQRVDGIIPLKENTAALLVTDGEKTRIMVYDYTASAVLAQKEVPVYGECVLTRMDGSTFYFADGQKGWQVTADASLAMAEYTLQSRLWMGDKKVDNIDGSILVDGHVVLQGRKGAENYLFLSSAGADRLLYEVYVQNAGPEGNYGIYDHSTGESRLVTTMGQRVLGVWKDTLVISRTINHNQKYELGVFDLKDFKYTDLKIGHESVDRAVDQVQCNDEGTRLQVTWTDADGIHVQIFDLETQQELYTWTAPAEGSWNFFPAEDNALMVWNGENDDLTVWKVEY